MQEYIVELEHINKSFPGVKALDDVSFNLKSGEVLALLGENGAGKSTLMKILSGVYTRDSGDITLFGERIDELTPKKAQALGVAIIHQELNMCGHLTVAENIFLGREKLHSGILNEREMRKEAAAILGNLNIDIDPDTIVGDLPVSKQQMVEIAKALSTNAKILIMDEPTSALTSKEIDDLFVIIRKLRAAGHGIVYISHRLEELQHIVDRVTIMRDGRFITTMNFKDTNMSEIIAYMVGREIKEKFPRVTCARGKKILEVRNLNAGRLVRDINLDLYAGEIVGVAGLMGAGRTETTRAIFGIDPKESGEILLDGKEIHIRKPMDAIKAGIVLAPEDRKKDGLCTKLSIRDNIALPNLDILCNKFGVVNRKKEAEIVERSVKELTIKLASSESDAGSLSGGNQQKVVIGRALSTKPKLVILDEPTRGIDAAARGDVYSIISHLRDEGVAVLLISSDMEEIVELSDRAVTVYQGRINAEFQKCDINQDNLMAAAFGVTDGKKVEA